MKNVREYLNFSELSDQLYNKNDLNNTIENSASAPKNESDLDGLTKSILELIRVNQQLNKGGDNQEWCCINELLESKLTPDQKENIINQIHKTGFSKMKEAFWILNRACENMLCEPEDLIGIFKRRIFNHPDPKTDQEKMYFIGRYLNLTMIQINMLKNRDKLIRTKELQSVKSESTLILLPLLGIILSFLKNDVKTEV